MTDMPLDTEEIKYRLGITTGRVMGLPEIRIAQNQLTAWVIAAAEERWPDAMKHVATWWTDARMEAAWAHAYERWPGVEQVADALTRAERHIIRGSEPLA